jgi:hypothetical protein
MKKSSMQAAMARKASFLVIIERCVEMIIFELVELFLTGQQNILQSIRIGSKKQAKHCDKGFFLLHRSIVSME